MNTLTATTTLLLASFAFAGGAPGTQVFQRFAAAKNIRCRIEGRCERCAQFGGEAGDCYSGRVI